MTSPEDVSPRLEESTLHKKSNCTYELESGSRAEATADHRGEGVLLATHRVQTSEGRVLQHGCLTGERIFIKSLITFFLSTLKIYLN